MLGAGLWILLVNIICIACAIAVPWLVGSETRDFMLVTSFAIFENRKGLRSRSWQPGADHSSHNWSPFPPSSTGRRREESVALFLPVRTEWNALDITDSMKDSQHLDAVVNRTKVKLFSS
jgi:hypothetical protein